MGTGDTRAAGQAASDDQGERGAVATDETRQLVQRQVDEHGARRVARELGVSRGGLTSYLVGRATKGNRFYIEAIARKIYRRRAA